LKTAQKSPQKPQKIKAAHIGVGISGREGRAAAQAADFACGQFRCVV
jgi:magnesium-transporting ATPase (P-type)